MTDAENTLCVHHKLQVRLDSHVQQQEDCRASTRFLTYRVPRITIAWGHGNRHSM